MNRRNAMAAMGAAAAGVVVGAAYEARAVHDGHAAHFEACAKACVKCEVECEKTVLVGEGARVLASIAADEVQIAGLVEGDITARRKITLQRTAVVSGDLTTPGIVIEEGAKLKGRILIGSDAVPADALAEPELAREAKKAQALKKAPAAGSKPSEAPAPQPVTATA